MENKEFDFVELEKTLKGIETKLAELEKTLDSLKTRESPPPPPGTGASSGRPPFRIEIPEIKIPEIDIPEIQISGRESKQKTEEFALSDFTGIEAGGNLQVEIARADSYSISVTAEEDMFRNLDVSKEGSILRIGHSRHIGWRAQLTRARAKITLPVLKELRLSGASRGTISGFNSAENFRLELSGAGSLSGDIIAGDADFEVSGASRARLTGSAKDAVIEASGANRMELSDFSVHNAAVRLGGASHVTLRIDGKLDARLSGASHLSYIGNPTMGNIKTSGASRLSRE